MGIAVEIIANRNASCLRDVAPLRRVIERFCPHAHVHELERVDDLDRIASEVAKRRAERVVICGGDGSIMHTTTTLFRVFGPNMPALIFAPLGTVCTIARAFGFSGASGVRRALSLAADPHATFCDHPSLLVRDPEERVGFIFGAGLVSNFFELYDALPTRGRIAASKLVGKIFVDTWTRGPLAKRVLTPVPATIAMDGQSKDGSWSLVAASTLTDLGLHLKLTYRAGDENGKFHFVASELGPRELSMQLGRVLCGKALSPSHVDALLKDVRVTFPKTSTYVLDGESLRSEAVTLTSGPSLRIALR